MSADLNAFASCLYTFLACICFCFLFNIRGRLILYAAVGGLLGWAVYLALSGAQNDIFQYFIASLVISAYSEIMARVHKIPVTVFLIISLFPLVPGGGIYYSMEACIAGDAAAFAQKGMHTLAIAGVLTLGILLVSSVVRLWKTIRFSLHPR